MLHLNICNASFFDSSTTRTLKIEVVKRVSAVAGNDDEVVILLS